MCVKLAYGGVFPPDERDISTSHKFYLSLPEELEEGEEEEEEEEEQVGNKTRSMLKA